MLLPRMTPCLLVKNGGLVKTVKFGSPKYVGDPLNAVRIFNEKEVDELIVMDIDATVHRRRPDLNLIKNLAAECRMPICYGGGVDSVEQFETIVSLGVEKVAIASAAVRDPSLISRAARLLGSQSVVVVIDAKVHGETYEVVTQNGTKRTGISPEALARQAQDAGAGEIVINSVDKDGTMTGYDLSLIRSVRRAATLPITALGGAGSLQDLGILYREFGVIGAAAGSLFVFKGTYRAVLINYPSRAEKQAIFKASGCLPHTQGDSPSFGSMR